jgi:CheY-like chemotaxis protein
MNSALPSINRVLLVEDQAIIALDVEYMLTDCGVSTVDTAANVAEAFAFLKAVQPDAAVLDLNLGGSTSLPIAEVLLPKGIPFVFSTGYCDNSMVPAEFAHVPIVTKPYDAERLARALLNALDLLGKETNDL